VCRGKAKKIWKDRERVNVINGEREREDYTKS